MTKLTSQNFDISKTTENLVVFCDQNKKLNSFATKIDEKYNNKISTYLQFADFDAKTYTIETFNIVDDNKITNITIVCLGNSEKLDKVDFYKVGLTISTHLRANKTKIATIITEDNFNLDNLDLISQAILWHNYEFTEWKSNAEDTTLLEVFFQTNLTEKFSKVLSHNQIVNDCVCTARDLVNRPANVVTPEYLANEAQELKNLGVKVTVLDKKKIEKLGLNLLLSVGKGSKEEPKLVIMEYYGIGKGAENHALVGKGITFDTGGYSLKSSEGMKNMKSDMGGAAAVLGTVKALATNKTPINVIALMACAENMVSSNAVKVSDVVKSYNGITVENMNTDAEGRLVLADAISYVIRNYEVSEVIDIATLTGACMVALGAEYAGVIGYDQAIVDCLTEAGKQSHEHVWQLPINENYAESLHSDTADTSNIGGAYAGATTAACFIHKFTEDKPWAHLDIAGMALAGKIPGPLAHYKVKGATGFGVRLLTKYYENKVK